MRRALLLFAVPAFAVGCGGERQDAGEPSGTIKVEVVGATFPARQHIAESVKLRVRVRNASNDTVRNVAVTVETKARGNDAAVAFGANQRGADLASAARPIWI